MKNNKFNDVYLKVSNWVTDGEDVQYNLSRIDNKLTVVFQCSESESDWKHNFDFFTMPYKNMREPFYAHRGFVHMYQSIRDNIIQIVLDMEADGVNEIEIVAYSLGGGIATLFIEDLNHWLPNIKVTSYLYRTPRIIWMPSKSIRDRFKSVHRISAKNDLVTALAPFWLGFASVGKETILPNNSIFPSPEFHYPKWYSNSNV